METHTSTELLKRIADASDLPEVNEQMTIDELGLDSLGFLDLLISLDIPREEIGELHTVGDIAAYVSSRKVG